MPGPEIFDLPPGEAIARFRAKGYHIGFDWRDTDAYTHTHSFTVAKAARVAILRDIRAAVDSAIANGHSFRRFYNDLRPTLERKGWWGEKLVTDPRTGKRIRAQLGSLRRLRTIFDTNLATAYAQGKWDRIQRLKQDLPYLRYVAVNDDRTRPEHRAWHNTVLPVGDGWWDTHYPPNGWGCRCTVVQLDDDDLERYGLSLTQGTPPFSSSGDVRPWRNKRTGKVHQVPRGIDPGWDHNVGAVAGIIPAFQRRVVRAMGADFDSYLARTLQLMAARSAQRHNLTDPELVALHAYSIRQGPWAFRTLNQALRSRDDAAMAAVRDRVFTLEAALQKLPPRTGQVFRGTELPPHILLQYTRAYEATDKRGSIVSDPAFMSTTATPRETYEGPHTIIVKKPDAGQKSRGSHMADFAENRAEDEVLFPPGTPFEVLDMQRGDNDTVTFWLEEVIP